MLKATENEDEQQMIRSLGGTLSNQFSELSSYIRERSTKLSGQQIRETNQVLRLASAETLVATGINSSGFMFLNLNTTIGGAGIVAEIKKIIRMILELFGELPSWFDGVALLIDELLNLLISIFSPSLASPLSINEQNRIAELTQLSRLQRANRTRFELDQEENT